MRRLAVLALALASASCSAVLHFHECDTSADCAGRGGGTPLYCNVQHQCIDSSPCYVSQEAAPGDHTLVIAGLFLSSEPSDGPNDHAIRQAVDLAAFELDNQSVPVRHVACDTGGDSAQALKAFDIAVTQFGAVAVVGPNSSSELLALAPEAKKRGVAVVSPAASAATIADIMDDNLVWRTCASDNLQAKVLSTLVPAASKPLDVVWVPKDPYADGLAKAFIATSGRTDATPIQFESGDVATAVAQMNAPAYAVLVVDVDGPALLQALHGAAGQSTTQYLMTDSALTPTLWGAAPFDFSFLTRIRGTAPALPAFSDASGPVYAAFSAAYRGHWMQEDPADTAFVANAYDATYAIAMAAAASGAAATGRSIATNLARMSDQAPAAQKIQIGSGEYQAGVNALAAGATIDLVGTSGPIDWDDAGDVLMAPTEVWQVANDGTGAPMFKILSTITP